MDARDSRRAVRGRRDLRALEPVRHVRDARRARRLFLLFKGIFDITVAFITKDEFELWWLQLVIGLLEILLAFWVAGNFREEAILLVIYVGIIALVRGISEIFVAFKLKGLRRRLAAA